MRQLNFASLVHPDDRAANLIETRRLKGGEQSFFEIINRYLRKDGAPVWVRKFVYTLPGETGAPAYMVALVTDISERMRTEAALTQERDYSRRIINTVPAIVLLLDARGYIQHVNPYFEQLSGYRLEEIRGKEWFATFLPERDRDRVRELFHHATGGEPTRGNVNAIVTRSGIEREIEWYDQRMTNMDGTFTALLAIGLDVTERRAAEQMRHEDATRLKLALDGADMGAWDWNIAADTSVWNAREHELFGFAPGEFSGATSEVLGRLHPQDRDRIAKALERAVAHNELYRDEFRVVHPDGTVRWLAGRAHPIRDAAGKVTRLIGVNYDITDRKNEELERERRHEDEMARLYRIGTVNELAGGLAHELSQPLTAIQNYAGGCLHWLDTHGEYGQLRHALAAINDQSARVVAIIQHLRSLITTGEPQRAPADVNTLVARARDLLKIPLARKNVTVTMELAPELPKAFIDALQIEQVVIILMRNCVDAFTGKYLARPAIVLCTTQSGPNSVEITVADNGPGVAPESLPRLFEPFYTTKPKGMGLGLMLAHSIVRAHNGSIRAERGSGGGLMVRITLPIDRGDQ